MTQITGIILLSLAVGQAEHPQAEVLKPGNHLRYLECCEGKRSFLVHVPAGCDPKKPTPVVLALHGATMTAAMMQSFTGLNKKADEAGFVVVYPNGTGPGNLLLTWNAGGFAPGIAKTRPDDVAFIARVLDDLESVLHVDKKRIFACGLSNGGMMCYRLAAELSDRIAAIASVAGTIAIDKCEPKRPVPVLHFHGTEDKLVPYSGAKKTVAAFLKFIGVEDSIAAWVKIDGCNEEPKTCILAADRDKHEVTRKHYGGGKDGSEVILYVIKDGGHTWPGRAIGGGLIGAYTLNISANDIIWEFFQRHPMR